MTIQQNTQYIQVLLELARKPVGIKFLLTKEAYEAFPADEFTNRMSYCTIVSRASRGKGGKFHAGHMACGGGATAIGLTEPTQDTLSGQKRLSQGAYEDLCVSRKISKNMAYCQHSAYGAAALPLELFDQPPDVAILVCNAFNAMRIVQAYAFSHGHARNICLSGMQAVCQECTSFPYEKDQLNLSLMCSGTRMLAGWSKDELAVGMPGRLFEKIVQGLSATVNPLERNAEKAGIQKRSAQSGLNLDFDLAFNRNYDDGCYRGGPVDQPTKSV